MTPSVVPQLRRGATSRWRTAGALASGALLVALAGCSNSTTPAAKPTPAPTVRMGGPNIVDSDDGVRLTLPAGWRQIPLGSGPDTTLRRLVPDPSQRRDIDQQIQVGQLRGMRLFALQPASNRRPNSLNVAITRATSATLDSLQAEIKLASSQYADGAPRFDRVQLPAGQSLRVHYRLRDGDSTTQYYVLAFTQAYILTVTATAGGTGAPADLAVADAVARTLRLSPVA